MDPLVVVTCNKSNILVLQFTHFFFSLDFPKDFYSLFSSQTFQKTFELWLTSISRKWKEEEKSAWSTAEMELGEMPENKVAVRYQREGKSKLGSCLALLILLLLSLAPRKTSLDPKLLHLILNIFVDFFRIIM